MATLNGDDSAVVLSSGNNCNANVGAILDDGTFATSQVDVDHSVKQRQQLQGQHRPNP